MRQQEPAVAVEHLQVRIGVGDDLAQKGIDPHVAGELLSKRLALVLVGDRLEAVHGRLQVPLHVRMIGGALPLHRLVEHLGERLDLAPVIDLHLVELVLQRVQHRRVRGLRKLGLVVVGLEGAVDVLGVVDEVEHERRRPCPGSCGSGARASAPPARRRGACRRTSRTAAAGRSRSGTCWRPAAPGSRVTRSARASCRFADGLAGHDIGVHARLGVLEARVRVASPCR